MLSKIAQFFIGLVLGLLVVGGVIAGAGYLYFSQYSKNPIKPTFSNDEDAVATPTFNPYTAEVTYAKGLFLREEPTKESKTLKVLQYQQKLTVLDTPRGKKYDKVRVKFEDDTVLEGWVSAGNIKRIADEEAKDAAP